MTTKTLRRLYADLSRLNKLVKNGFGSARTTQECGSNHFQNVKSKFGGTGFSRPREVQGDSDDIYTHLLNQRIIRRQPRNASLEHPYSRNISGPNRGYRPLRLPPEQGAPGTFHELEDDAENEHEYCGICYASLTGISGQDFLGCKNMRCKLKYHYNCLCRWFNSKPNPDDHKCPNCQEVYSPSQVDYICNHTYLLPPFSRKVKIKMGIN